MKRRLGFLAGLFLGACLGVVVNGSRWLHIGYLSAIAIIIGVLHR